MPQTRFLLIAFMLVVLVTCGTCLTQVLQRPQSIRVRIEVTYEDGQTKVRDATVELMDAVGGASSRQTTGSDGRAEFISTAGKHRVRITGPEVETLDTDFEIAPVEGFHIEHFRLRRRLDPQTGTPVGSTVPTARLKVPEKARKEFDKGGEALKNKQWQDSRAHFQAAIDIYPDYDLAYNGLGVAAYQANDTAAAELAFTNAIRLNPKFAEAQRNLARILLTERNNKEALQLLKSSLETESGNAWALTNCAYLELQARDFENALAHALRVHSLPHAEFANVHMVAGYAAEALGRKELAVKEFKHYLEEDPNGPNVKRARELLTRLQAVQ